MEEEGEGEAAAPPSDVPVAAAAAAAAATTVVRETAAAAAVQPSKAVRGPAMPDAAMLAEVRGDEMRAYVIYRD